MDRFEVEKTVTEIVRATLNISELQHVGADDNLIEQFHADSLDLVEVFMEIELKLDVNIPDSKLRFIDTGVASINNIVDVTLSEIQTNS